MEEYFYFTMHFKSTGERRFLGDVTEHRWGSWEQAVEISNSERNMPLRSQWRIAGDRLIATFASDITIELNSTGYEQHYEAALATNASLR